MKRLQCTKCEQVFWTELTQIDEDRLGSGDWIKNPCPRCGAEWAMVEPGMILQKEKAPPAPKSAPSRKPRPKSIRQIREEDSLNPTGIRRLRRNLGISQKELADLAGVSAGSVLSWEKGKFKPKKEKIAKLKELAEMSKEDARRILDQKSTPMKEERKALKSRPLKRGRKGPTKGARSSTKERAPIERQS